MTIEGTTGQRAGAWRRRHAARLHRGAQVLVLWVSRRCGYRALHVVCDGFTGPFHAMPRARRLPDREKLRVHPSFGGAGLHTSPSLHHLSHLEALIRREHADDARVESGIGAQVRVRVGHGGAPPHDTRRGRSSERG